MVSPNQDPYEVPTLKHWRIIHTYMAWIQSYCMNSGVIKEIHKWWSSRVLKTSIVEAKPKYYHSAIQGSASALNAKSSAAAHGAGSQVSSQTSGSPLGHTHLPQQSQNPDSSAHTLTNTSKAWVTKAQQDWPVNVTINSWLLACKAEIG
jgi:hypothetical protein